MDASGEEVAADTSDKGGVDVDGAAFVAALAQDIKAEAGMDAPAPGQRNQGVPCEVSRICTVRCVFLRGWPTPARIWLMEMVNAGKRFDVLRLKTRFTEAKRLDEKEKALRKGLEVRHSWMRKSSSRAPSSSFS